MSSIIKAGSAPAARTGVRSAVFNVEDVRREAQQHLEQIRQQAAGLLQQAKAEAVQVRKQAEQQGRDAARQQAEQASKAEVARRVEALAPALERAAAEVAAERQAWRRHWEDQAVGLAIALAERIVRRELARDPVISQAWLREALELAAGGGTITLRLNPADVQLLGDAAKRLAAALSTAAPVNVVGDPAVPPGGCVAQTQFGEVDQRLESQLARLAEELA